MFWINLKIALRNLRKNKLFNLINIFGLAVGLTIYLFTSLYVKYVNSFDTFFSNSDRIYTVSSLINPDTNVPLKQINSTYTAVGPILSAEFSDIEAVARIIVLDSSLIRVGENLLQETLVYADPDFFQIFDFNYLHGNKDALRSPDTLLITASRAIELFGSTDVIGETITVDNALDLSVAAVIEDIPINSHFDSRGYELFTSMATRPRLGEGDWIGGNEQNLTYVLLPEHLDQAWLNNQLDNIYQKYFPEDARGNLSGQTSLPLRMAAISPVDLGVVLRIVIPALGLLVLIIACANFTNLAVAQSLGRSRELGLRKTMGATRQQLLFQFLLESVLITALAMCLAVAALEILIPIFNSITGNVLNFSYTKTLAWLICTTLIVGLAAGLYPAGLIARSSTIDALRDLARKGRKSSAIRSAMIGTQFTISTFLLAVVIVVYFQNNKIVEGTYIFPRSEIYVMSELWGVGQSIDRERLQREIKALPGVKSMAFSSQTPLTGTFPTLRFFTEQGNPASALKINQMGVSSNFFETYDIPILAGRNLDENITSDFGSEEAANVLISELALPLLGASSPEEALNRRIYSPNTAERPHQEFIVVGVTSERNIGGFISNDTPWMFRLAPSRYLYNASIRFHPDSSADILQGVEIIWNEMVPTKPLQAYFMGEDLDEEFSVLKTANIVLFSLTFIALSLALIGLFGLTAFIALQRTKEIGVRKALGANSAQLTGLLIRQFSKPVIWALAIAIPLAFLASNLYVQFFSDRIEYPILVILLAGLISALLGLGIVGGQAFRIARAKPITALRYE